LAHAAAISPDLIIINRQLPDGDGAALIQPLRTRLGGESVRIIVLTDSPHTIEPAATGGTAATDYLALPGSLPILRTRVRTWLGRTLMLDWAWSVSQPRRVPHAHI
jgi:DNA-binding response OmpR family regulator